MKKENPFSLFADSDCELTENPLWNDTDRMLYWKGWTPGTIYRKAIESPAASFERFLLPVGQIGGFAFMPDGALLIFAQHGRVWSWTPGKSPVKLAELPGADDKTFFNDLIADPEGRIFVGMLARDFFNNLGNPHAEWTSGSLWRFDPDLSFHCLEPSIGNTPNGMGFSLDRNYFYFAVTDENTVYRYHYDPATGRISNRTALIHSPVCDGMTVDSEGCLWIAQAGGHPLARYSPEGVLLAEERLSVKGLTSVTFGGDDLKTIFVTTAKSPNDPNASAGGVFLKRQEIRGVPEFPAAKITILRSNRTMNSLWNTYDNVRDRLDEQCNGRGFPADTGMTPAELETRAMEYLDAHKEEPRIRIRAAVFSFLFRNARIRVDAFDWFADHIDTGEVMWKIQQKWRDEFGGTIPARR